MDHAELKGKVPASIRDDEDVLTSTAFGLLELLPTPDILLRWLKSGRDISGRFPPLADSCETVSLEYWPRFPELGDQTEIDLLLSLHKADGDADLAGIEVKFKSGPSGWPVAKEIDPAVRGQLGREWKIIESLPPERTPGAPRQLHRRLLFYLTPEPSQPRHAMRAMAAEVAEKGGAAGMIDSLFWLTWLDLFVIVQEALLSARGMESKILGRLLAYLRSRGLESFSGFARPPIVTTSWHYHRRTWGAPVIPVETGWSYA